MSGQWEIVRGKNQKHASKLPIAKNGKIPINQPKNNGLLNDVNIEEILPRNALITSNYDSNKLQAQKAILSEKKENLKKKLSNITSKTLVASKPKTPKSLEEALSLISAREFAEFYEKTKNSFPNAPILWLKELAQYLNHKASVEILDPTFRSKPRGYPSNMLPSNLKSTIEKCLNEASSEIIQFYFDIALQSMVTDLSKGLNAVGYRFFLQLIALKEPEFIAKNLGKSIDLKNAFMNRPNIILAIFWSVGQVGLKDFHLGLKVFQDLMLPLIKFKNYTNFLQTYLLSLIHTAVNNKELITIEEFISMLDVLFMEKVNFSSQFHKELLNGVEKLNEVFLVGVKQLKFEEILRRINLNGAKQYQNNLCKILMEILKNSPNSFTEWTKIYPKYLVESAIFLNYIDGNYHDLNEKMKNNLRKKTFPYLEGINKELMEEKKRNNNIGLIEAINALKKVQQPKKSPSKKTNNNNKEKNTNGKSSLLKIFIYILFVLIALEPFYRPFTNREDLFVIYLSGKFGEISQWIDEKLENSQIGPNYANLKKTAEHYTELSRDFVKIAVNTQENLREYIREKIPLIVDEVNIYAPGLIDQISVTLKGFSEGILHIYQTGAVYLQKEIFVGQFSLENLQKAACNAFNQTSLKAIEYYRWVSQKVQTSIK